MDKSNPIVISDPPMCFKPAQWVCSQNGPLVCGCVIVPPTPVQNPGRLCTASIIYGEFTPHNPRLSPMEPHCDLDSALIALAVIVSRLVQGMP